MARVSGLTVATVSAAVDAIKARGERVTLRSVRGELGEGSLTTVQRLLGEIGEDRPAPVAQVKKAEGSSALPDRIAQAINTEIETAKEAVREELQEVIERLTADLDAAMKEGERMAGEIEQLKEVAAECEKISAARLAERDLMAKAKDEIAAELKSEREARHAAELDAAKQAGLAQDIKKQADEAGKENAKTISEAKTLIAEISAELKTEREARHAAELDAAKQAGLAQRMQDVACELRERLESAQEKAGKPAGKKTPAGTKAEGQ